MYRAEQAKIPLIQKTLPFTDDCKNGLKFIRLETNNPTTSKKSRDSKILNYSRNSSIYQ